MEKNQKPLPQYENYFLDWLEIEKGLSNNSQKNYSRFLKKFFEWLNINNLNNLKPNELTPDHIWKYRLFLSRQYFSKTGKQLKFSTQSYYLIALRSFLTFFAEKDITSLPPEKIKLPKGRNEKNINFLTLDQIEKLFNAVDISDIKGLRDRAILETLFSTGLRVAELVSLNRDQIKLKDNLKDLEISIIGKGSRVRTVYLSERAINWLKKYLDQRKDNKKALFIGHRKHKDSDRLTIRSIERIVKKYVMLAGLPPNITVHSLRHSFATDLLMKGVDLRIVQEFLGHKNIATTQVYTHITKPHLREIHRKYHGKKI